MTGRANPTTRFESRRWAQAIAAALCVFGLLVVGLLAIPATAQTTDGPTIADQQPPLPLPDSPAQKYKIPSSSLFSRIKDYEPVATEAQDKLEYEAWTEFVAHANKFDAADLERYAAREWVSQDLTHASPSIDLRTQLIAFEGLLSQVTRVEPTKALKALNIVNMYQAKLVPVDDSSADAIRIAFVDLPAGVEVGGADRWVSFAGYFFKLIPDASAPVKRAGEAHRGMPLLVGKSVTPLAAPPSTIALDKHLLLYSSIRDDNDPGGNRTVWREDVARQRIFLHARRFGEDELEAAGRRDLGFRDLFLEGRSAYRFALIYLEGRLLRVRKLEDTPQSKEAGIPALYECWMIPKGANGNPISIQVTELPAGIQAQPSDGALLNHWISFGGYSFKLCKYSSQERQKDDPTKNVWKLAPVLIGHSFTLRRDPELESPLTWGETFVYAMIGLLMFLGIVALGLKRWFRRGDERVKKEIDALRNRNPFGEVDSTG